MSPRFEAIAMRPKNLPTPWRLSLGRRRDGLQDRNAQLGTLVVLRGQLLPRLHQRSHEIGLLDGGRQEDEHGEVVLDGAAPGEEIVHVAWHHIFRDRSCSHGKLHAERNTFDHASVMAAEKKVAPELGASAPRDDALAKSAELTVFDDLSGARALKMAGAAIP